MTFERVLYVARRSDADACAMLKFLSSATKAETRELEDGEAIDTELPIIPIMTYQGNGQYRFPSKTLRAIRLDKENPDKREIPVPDFAMQLAGASRLVVAIKPLQRSDQGAILSKAKEAIHNFHRDQTGENLSPGTKTHRPRKKGTRRSYASGGLCGGYE